MTTVVLDRETALTNNTTPPLEPEHFEIVRGRYVEKEMSWLSSWVAGELHRRLSTFVLEHGLGRATPSDLGYRCFPDDPSKVRRPDVSFISANRITREVTRAREVMIAPDLAVEVVSPNDLAYEVENKAIEYLEAGVLLVWVINPEARTVHIYRRYQPWQIARADDLVSGEEVVPNFEFRVSDLLLEDPVS